MSKIEKIEAKRKKLVIKPISKYREWEFAPEFPPHPGEHGIPENLEEIASDVVIESICGGIDDSQPVEQYDGTLGVTIEFVMRHQKPVGQLQWNNNLGTIYDDPGNVSGVRWCSGTLISCNLFLTAGHCFDQTGGGWRRPRINGTTTIISPEEIATNMQVNFNYQVDPNGNLRQEEVFAVELLLEFRLGGLDYAIIRIAGNPGRRFRFARISENDANVNDMLCIIGHPVGLPKMIEAGPCTELVDNQIRYDDIDTLGGNSGSGIIGPEGTIVGVHTNGGCNIAAIGHNYGVRISSILSASAIASNLATNKTFFTDLQCSLVKLKIADDKIKFLDDGKLKFLDDGKLKFLDDGKLKFLDDGKFKAQDDKFKHIDDVKTPGYDKFGPADIGPQLGINRGNFPGVGVNLGPGRSPFILSIPHKFPSNDQPSLNINQQTTKSEYEKYLSELEHAITTGSQELEKLKDFFEKMSNEYKKL